MIPFTPTIGLPSLSLAGERTKPSESVCEFCLLKGRLGFGLRLVATPEVEVAVVVVVVSPELEAISELEAVCDESFTLEGEDELMDDNLLACDRTDSEGSASGSQK